MITLETALAAIVTFLLGVAAGFYFWWIAIGKFKAHAIHCSACRARIISLFDEHAQSAPDGICPWRGWYETHQKGNVSSDREGGK